MVNTSNTASLVLMQQMEDLVLNSFKVPMSSKVMMDEELFFDLLDQLRQTLPDEVKKAQEVLQEKDKILADAKTKAEKIVTITKEKSQKFLEKNEVVKEAQLFAEQTRQEAERQKYEADKYSDQVLAELEVKVNRALEIVQTGRKTLSETMEITSTHIASPAQS